jgi:hypothetical protein
MQSCNAASTYQICRTNGECANDAGSPVQCLPQTCTAPMGMFGGGSGGQTVTLEACWVPGTMGMMGGMTNNGALPYCTPN